MHKNTYKLIVFLSIIATLTGIVNITGVIRDMDVSQSNLPKIKTAASITPPKSDSEKEDITRYINPFCLFSMDFPNTLTLHEDASGTATLVDPNSDAAIIMTCQEDIPRPPIPIASIEKLTIHDDKKTATVEAMLYHDKSAEDGTPIDALIYFNPDIKKDVFIAGYGSIYMRLVNTVKLVRK